MSRIVYIQHPETHKLIEESEYRALFKNTSFSSGHGFFVQPDIEPYQVPGTDQWISSRSHHRKYLRANNMIEVGNERVDPKPKTEPKSAVQDILAAMEKHGVRYRP